MLKLNKKGFTLVELLAVIVVLAIIMLLAIPSVLGTLSDAQRGTFKIYAEKVLNQAQSKYQSDVMLGFPENESETTIKKYDSNDYCYTIDGGLGMTSTGNYKGYVIVTLDAHLVPTFYITLTDNNFSVKYYQYADLKDTDYGDPDTTISNSCPSSLPNLPS
ncbi:MAG: type II secretion system protein [Bacilli bacterium]|nr:type II secretion system protein [Bacilli bacterium]